MSSRFVPAALAGMVTLASVGFLLYRVLFAGLFEAKIVATGVMETPPAFLWIGLAHVPFGILLTLVISWSAATSARGGALIGATLGFLMAASYDNRPTSRSAIRWAVSSWRPKSPPRVQCSAHGVLGLAAFSSQSTHQCEKLLAHTDDKSRFQAGIAARCLRSMNRVVSECWTRGSRSRLSLSMSATPQTLPCRRPLPAGKR